MCNDNFFHGGIVFPNFSRYACCNPCCDGSVMAERVESIRDNNNNRCCCCPCCNCCNCCNNGNVGGTSDDDCSCHHHCDDDNDVGGISDNNFRCPCRGGW